MPGSSGQPGSQTIKKGHRGVDSTGETTYKKVSCLVHNSLVVAVLLLAMQVLPRAAACLTGRGVRWWVASVTVTEEDLRGREPED